MTTVENKIPDTSNLATKTELTTVENEIPDISNLATKTALTTVENKIPDTSNLATKTALTTVENKIPDTSNLTTKTALSTVENKIPNISNLATKTLVSKVENKIPDISNLVKKANYDAKMTSINSKFNKSDLELKELIIDNGLGDIFFNSDDGNQAYLIFQPVHKYFKTDNDSAYISGWKSKGLSNEGIKPP